MTGIVDWASGRARMIIAFVIMSIAAGAFSYIGLPKEGEPDIEIPALFISVPFPGISATDSEKLLVRPMESRLRDLDGLDRMSATAGENYAGIALEFEFGWDKTKILADVRDKMSQAEAEFPEGAETYTVNEINFSEFPILVVSLSGDIPERTLLRVAKELQDELESLAPVLEAGLAGHRNEMLEVVIDPLRLEAYNVTASELISVVTNNNRLIAAGEVQTESGAFSIKIPSSFNETQDVYNLPVKVNGDRVITLGELAEIRLTFEDRAGTARYNGQPTVALQVVKRKGFNAIDTVALVKERMSEASGKWPQELQASINISYSMDESIQVSGMVGQLEASVLTAIALVMIVVLAALGTRSALLVGFAIPTSFLLSFALMAVMGMAISNIVMFGLILAVGMLVDGAIVVVEYADKEIQKGVGPMRAYASAAKRMFWPIVSSTATTLCAFLPMLFWPGVPGQFMGNLPVTLIFVLSASLIVALIYLPVIGGVAGRFSRNLTGGSAWLKARFHWVLRVLMVPVAIVMQFGGIMLAFREQMLPGTVLFMAGAILLSIVIGSFKRMGQREAERAGYRRSFFGTFIHFITGNPVMPFVAIGVSIAFMMSVFSYFGTNNNGVEFFVTTEPERAIVQVRARGNLSLSEKDALVRQAEAEIMQVDGVESIFAFAGEGGLNQNTGGAQTPKDSIGQVQIELEPWDERGSGQAILDEIQSRLATIPGIIAEVSEQAMGPASGKPISLRVKGADWDELLQAAGRIREHFDATPELTDIEDTRPLPGIDWEINVDVEKAGRYGADVTTVGAMVQLVTNGLKLGAMRTETSDEEIDIRVRLPEEDRLLSTLDTLRVRTQSGLVPLSNFTSRRPVPKLGEINRVDTSRYFDIKADVIAGVNSNEEIAKLEEWLASDAAGLPESVTAEWVGDQEEQEESQAFLSSAFAGALGLMFVILLAQFNSVYNSILVLVAVVMSVTGVLIGMLVMDQTFSIIMTGTGIVALAGIVVNNNIVLIDTYQEFSRYMPRLDAIVRTAEARIRPVLLTTITTMAGLAPMMFGISIDFVGGGYTLDAPTALWWKQLATAVVFGLGLATVLTLIVTPAALAARVWATAFLVRLWDWYRSLSGGRDNISQRDLRLKSAARKARVDELDWVSEPKPEIITSAPKAAE